MAGKYKSWSPYNYVAGNPVFNTDPDGRDIVIHTYAVRKDADGNEVKDEDGNLVYDDKYITYTPGMGLTGNKFADNVIKALNFIIGKSADPYQIIKSLASRKKDRLIIREGHATKGIYFTATYPPFSFMNDYNKIAEGIENGKPTVTWNPSSALGFGAKKATTNSFASESFRTPAENLLHELGHAYNFFESPMEQAGRVKTFDKDFDDMEERSVINGPLKPGKTFSVENTAANILYPNRKLNDRMHHGGRIKTVSSPITIK